MTYILDKPIEEGFYSSSKWRENILKYYCDEKNYITRDIYEFPVKLLTNSLASVLHYYANSPDGIHTALKQTINPMFDPDDYKKNIYEKLEKVAENFDDEKVHIVAVALYNIRKLFQQDKDLFKMVFAKQIAKIKRNTEDEKYEEFGKKIQTITKTHILQVAKQIEKRK